MNLCRLFERVRNADYTHIQSTSASYAVERVGDTLYLLFEQSNGAEDWLSNFNFPASLSRKKNGIWFAHRGFLRVWRSIEGAIQAQISPKTVKRIVIAGYSHGAALAVLCHEFCMAHRADIAEKIEGYGFGCPRVAWGYMSACVKARFANFTVVRNGKDLITYLPPVVLGFHHVGKMLKIGQDKGYQPIQSHRPEIYERELALYERARV